MTTGTEQGSGKRKALGRGLESLLPKAAPRVAEAERSGGAAGHAFEVAVEQIDRNPFQTRTQFGEAQLAELTESIRAMGVIQPVLLRALEGGRYQLIAGERRWLASQRAGKKTIPAVVAAMNDTQAMEATIVENLQRADLNPMEQARAFERLGREFSMTQEQMAVRTGKDRASVSNFLRLLRLPGELQQLLEAGALSFGHAKVLLALNTPEQMSRAAQKIQVLSMSVRQAESYVRGLLNPEQRTREKEKPKRSMDPNVREMETTLREELGMKVTIEDRNGRGKIVIEYADLEGFDDLVDRLTSKLV